MNGEKVAHIHRQQILLYSFCFTILVLYTLIHWRFHSTITVIWSPQQGRLVQCCWQQTNIHDIPSPAAPVHIVHSTGHVFLTSCNSFQKMCRSVGDVICRWFAGLCMCYQQRITQQAANWLVQLVASSGSMCPQNWSRHGWTTLAAGKRPTAVASTTLSI